MDSIEKLLPIVFFIIWIFFGVFGKGKKRTGSSPDKKPKPSGMGELGKTLRKVLEEMQGPVPVTEPDYGDDIFDDDEESPPNVAPRLEPEVPPVEVQERPYRQKNIPEPERVSSSKKIAWAKLRQGIILSEILAPPIALRE